MKLSSSRLIARHAHHNHLIGEAGEHFAGVSYSIDCAAGGRHRAVEVEVTSIARNGVGVRERKIEKQVAEGLVGLGEGTLHLLGEQVGFGIAFLENQAAHLRQHAQRLGVVRVARLARPERIFIELQTLLLNTAKDHRAQSAIPDRERVDPLPRGSFVPQG